MTHFNSNNPCWLCRVGREPGARLSLNDYQIDAEWKSELLDEATGAFDPLTDGQPIDNLHGLTRFHVPGDCMHTREERDMTAQA